MNLSIIDIAIIGAYLGLLLGFGAYFSFKKISPEHFMVAGRMLPGWLLGLSLTATDISSIAFLGFPSKTFAGDWAPFMMLISFPLVIIIVTQYLIPFFRKQNIISIYTYLQRRFGNWAVNYAVGLYFIFQISRMGVVVYLLSLVITSLTNIDPIWVIIITGSVVTFYTYTGGIEAVIWTDCVQSILFIAGGLGCLLYIFHSIPGGAIETFSLAQQGGKFGLESIHFNLSQKTIWVFLLFGFTNDLIVYGFNQDFVQRYVAAKSEKEAKKSVCFGACATFATSCLFFAIGFALYSYYQHFASTLPQSIGIDEAFPYFIATQIPAGLKGLVIVGLLAASMSSIDTSLNSTSTVFLCNVYKQYKNGKITDKESLKVLHISSLLLGIVGILFAITLIQLNKPILDFWWEVIALVFGGLVGLFILGILPIQISTKQAITALAIGTVVILWISLSPIIPLSLNSLTATIDPILSLFFGNVAVVSTGITLSYLTPRKTPSTKTPPTCDADQTK